MAQQPVRLHGSSSGVKALRLSHSSQVEVRVGGAMQRDSGAFLPANTRMAPLIGLPVAQVSLDSERSVYGMENKVHLPSWLP
jgi:hypothetical protein